MSRNLLKSTLVVAIAFGCWQSVGSVSSAQDSSPEVEPQAMPTVLQNTGNQPDLFYNYYPNTTVGVSSASMYPAPGPTPAVVGHTYYTYQPLLPHEYTYQHQRTYYSHWGHGQMYNPRAYGNCNSCAPGGNGMTRTTVVYHHAPFSYYNNPGHIGGHLPFSIFPGQNIRGWFNHGYRGNGCGCGNCQQCQSCR